MTTRRTGGRAALVALTAALTLTLTAGTAMAWWKTTGHGTGTATGGTINAPTGVTGNASTKLVTWTQSNTGAVTPTGFLAERSSTTGTRSWVTACSAGAGATSCTDVAAVPATDTFVFRVTAKYNTSWSAVSAESAASVTYTVAVASKLVITTGAVTGSASTSPTLGPITVQSQTSGGSAANAPSGGYTIGLTSNTTGTAKFATTSGGTSVTTVVIPAGSSSVSFFYADTKAGSPTITAAISGLTSATQVQTIVGATATSVIWTTDSAGLTNGCSTGNQIVGNGGSRTFFVTALDTFGNRAKQGATAGSVAITKGTGGGNAPTPTSLAIAANAYPAVTGGSTVLSIPTGSPADTTYTATLGSLTVNCVIQKN